MEQLLLSVALCVGVPSPLPALYIQATFLETGNGDEGFVQLAGTGSWVLARRDQDTQMVRLPGFPKVDKTPRRFVVSTPDGVSTIVGPSSAAPRTGHVLPLGTEGRSEMVWSVEGWPGDRGTGHMRFVLLEGMGWVQLDAGSEGNLREADAPPRPPPSSGGEEDGSSSGA